MYGILLTKNTTFIIGPVAEVLGYLMNVIFEMLDKIGIPNIGLSIIIFTIVINAVMLPLTVRQQKFSKFSAKMNPELQVVRKKYEGRKDNDSMMAMNQETQAIYAKYGVSPSGSCIQLAIQMPILFALYRVIYSMPAYVTKIREAFTPLIDELMLQDGAIEVVQNFSTSSMYSKQFTNELFLAGDSEYIANTLIDCLNRASSSDFLSLAEQFPNIVDELAQALIILNHYNNFLGLNIADSPSFIIQNAFASGAWLSIIGALMIPVLAGLSQWINTKLMPQTAQATGSDENSMAASMKMMNNIMPLMSAFFCLTFPSGMGIYWIAGAVVRCIQQVIINKHIDKIDVDALIAKNIEKNNKKREKAGLPPQTVTSNAKVTTRNVEPNKKSMSIEEKEAAIKKSNDYYAKNGKEGSIASKANMVKYYNEKNNK